MRFCSSSTLIRHRALNRGIITLFTWLLKNLYYRSVNKQTRPEHVCRGCGKPIRAERSHCGLCAIDGATERLARVAQVGRVVARSLEARAKHSASRRRHAQACSAWDASTQPAWLTAEFYAEKIRPRLARISSSAIASRIGVSRWYAGRIRQGYRPHPRHWQALATLVDVRSH